MIRRLVREPLVHFVAIGALLFGLWSVVGRAMAPGPETIVVARAEVEALTADYERTWRRPPTPEERERLIRDWVLEEASVREATARGLDREDGMIRRRLQQKLEFLAEADAEAEPTDAQLAAFFESRRDLFPGEDRFSFRHVYFNRETRAAHTEADARAALETLRRRGPSRSIEALGDPFLLDRAFEHVTTGEVAMRFGDAFAKAVATLPAGSWEGPIVSSYGLHLVLVTAHDPGRAPTFEEAKDDVRRAWREDARARARERLHDDLMKRYRVKIEAETPRGGF